ncbi:MAG: hypothetical protein V1743_06975 [Nanoarchaeota archaeon]
MKKIKAADGTLERRVEEFPKHLEERVLVQENGSTFLYIGRIENITFNPGDGWRSWTSLYGRYQVAKYEIPAEYTGDIEKDDLSQLSLIYSFAMGPYGREDIPIKSIPSALYLYRDGTPFPTDPEETCRTGLHMIAAEGGVDIYPELMDYLFKDNEDKLDAIYQVRKNAGLFKEIFCPTMYMSDPDSIPSFYP